MQGDPVGTQHASEWSDHRPGSGLRQRGGGTLGPSSADVGVVEEQHPCPSQRGPVRRRHHECRRVGAHVADGRPSVRRGRPDAGVRAPSVPPAAPPPHRARRRRRAPEAPDRDGGSTAPGRPRRSGRRVRPRAGRGRGGPSAGVRAQWCRSAAGPRPRATPCNRGGPRRAGPAAGTGAPARPEPGVGPGGGRPAGRRSTPSSPSPRGRDRRRRPRARGRARGRGQAAGAGSGRCRRKVPVARLTSTPSASRTVASP